MIRIAITQVAYDAICATLPLGSVAVEPYYNERGERLIWLEAAMVDRLGAMRRAGESYSDVILRVATLEGTQR
jgi:hypothetical protein